MITKKLNSWQDELIYAIRSPTTLLQLLHIDQSHLPAAIRAAKTFGLLVTHSFARRMGKGDIHDPLLAQVLPVHAECLPAPGFQPDPLKERAANPLPGLLHKYQSRVLLTISPNCAIHCRYCFRRHFPYQANNPGKGAWEQVFKAIENDPSIEEIIFSGGDPLTLNDGHLAWFCKQAASIAHVTTIRLHTRLPIVLPSRITPALLAVLRQIPCQVVMVVHCNHAQEIDASVRAAMCELKQSNITLLNQSVLLSRVNDNEKALIMLSKALFEAGVLPYYIHLLDPVSGSAHFAVHKSRAKQLNCALLQNLPGYLVPRFVSEDPNMASKVPLAIDPVDLQTQAKTMTMAEQSAKLKVY